MKLMKPIMLDEIPEGSDWLYEIKYDGFRCMLQWKQDSIKLISRNQHDLTANFPEIVEACLAHHDAVANKLPLLLDGELIIPNTEHTANFALLQKRGRLKNERTIAKEAVNRPAAFMAFDMLELNGKDLTGKRLSERKKNLKVLEGLINLLHIVPTFDKKRLAWETVAANKAEGVIAKRKKSLYKEGKKHTDWYKIKNWRTIHLFLTFYHVENDYFSAGVFDDDTPWIIGKCKHGLDDETFQTLRNVFIKNGLKETGGYRLTPAICAEIHTLDLLQGELREPRFNRLLPEKNAADCTRAQLELDMAMLPEKVEPSNTDKIFWPEVQSTKGDMLVYMREISPYMLPFLRDKKLTIIRCPDGVTEESFFQKHLPDYAPDFMKIRDTEDIVCNELDTLIWLANHGTIEYHLPFQPISANKPTEIVFDLDPPGREDFPLAIKAALLLKQILDNLELISFVKTSGGKGLQVHIPIPDDSMNYEQTGVITEAIALTLEKSYPDLFTTERLKRKRGGKLYLDYLQHGEGKTIIAPYSPRKTDDATVATPLFWSEVNEDLSPDLFTIDNVVARVKRLGCPFADYEGVGANQKMQRLIGMVETDG